MAHTEFCPPAAPARACDNRHVHDPILDRRRNLPSLLILRRARRTAPCSSSPACGYVAAGARGRQARGRTWRPRACVLARRPPARSRGRPTVWLESNQLQRALLSDASDGEATDGGDGGGNLGLGTAEVGRAPWAGSRDGHGGAYGREEVHDVSTCRQNGSVEPQFERWGRTWKLSRAGRHRSRSPRGVTK